MFCADIAFEQMYNQDATASTRIGMDHSRSQLSEQNGLSRINGRMWPVIWAILTVMMLSL